MSPDPDDAPPGFPSKTSHSLARLLLLRRIEVAAQAAVLLLAVVWLQIPLEIAPMSAVIAALACVNPALRWRLDKRAPVGNAEVFGHLAIDVVALFLLLYFSGGSANPFVSLFVLPPTLAAAMLPARYAWGMAAMTLLAYSALMFWNVPLAPPQGDLARWDALLARAAGATEHIAHSSGFALHILGMWLNFLISVAVAVYFLTRMAAALQRQESELSAAREAALRNEQILALGTLAAGAAHQLGTPLATMAVVIRELELHHDNRADLRDDLVLLREQVDRCKQTLSQILASTGQSRAESLRATPVDTCLRDLLEDWQLIRPRTRVHMTLQGPQPAPFIAVDRTLQQAILNLLDNAADAQGLNEEPLEFRARWSAENLRLDIVDSGPGPPAENWQRLGRAGYSTKTIATESPGGLGIGLFLSNATIERLGGTVELRHRDDRRHGACTCVTLPLPPQKE